MTDIAEPIIATTEETAGSVTPPEDFDAWLASQAEDMRTLVGGLHEKKVSGLRTALQSEREERKTERRKWQDQAAEAAKATGAEKDSALKALQADITSAGERADAANARADFFADAHDAGVQDVRTAWAAIREYELYDRKGHPDIAALKERCPYLFLAPRPTPPRVDAGAGANLPPAAANDFDSNLRRLTGRA